MATSDGCLIAVNSNTAAKNNHQNELGQLSQLDTHFARAAIEERGKCSTRRAPTPLSREEPIEAKKKAGAVGTSAHYYNAEQRKTPLSIQNNNTMPITIQ